LPLVAFALAAVALAAGWPPPAGAQPVPGLREHRWRHRVLVVFAPAPGSPADRVYREQLAEFDRRGEELRSRDVVVVPVGADAAGALRRQMGVPDGAFGVALVGKDGTVKLRRRALLPADRVLDTVDAMPMGAAEARRRRGA
jgi:hypothetical protein